MAREKLDTEPSESGRLLDRSREELDRALSELPNRRLPEQVELTAYFVVSETLTNVAKHAAATKASGALTQRDGRLGLRGLADRVAAGVSSHVGAVRGMRERWHQRRINIYLWITPKNLLEPSE